MNYGFVLINNGFVEMDYGFVTINNSMDWTCVDGTGHNLAQHRPGPLLASRLAKTSFSWDGAVEVVRIFIPRRIHVSAASL